MDYVREPQTPPGRRIPSIYGSRPNNQGPQEYLNEFWEGYLNDKPGNVTTIFPRSLYANVLTPTKYTGFSSTRNAAASYEAAAEECRLKVSRIVEECQQTNEKFTDPEFDLEGDWDDQNCRFGLDLFPISPTIAPNHIGSDQLRDALNVMIDSNIINVRSTQPALMVDALSLRSALGKRPDKIREPACVHRVDWIFDNPSFTVDGFSKSDVQQGNSDDCWWVAAVTALCSMEGLMEKVCVQYDIECGVYGFVFFRDGEWISTVVDDNLYLNCSDYDSEFDNYDGTGEKGQKYKQRYQTGSEALYYAKCGHPNETWLPLLEKAYAKVHGDYDAISGGHPGEAVEDMTGGVTTTLNTSNILRKEQFWKELMNESKGFIFAASAPSRGISDSKNGLVLNHAYSVLKAVEENDGDGKKVNNPWGKRSENGTGEWNGPWSDGSKEWAPYWMEKFDHRFGDDGIFWMSYEDFRQKFSRVHRTRLFDKKWVVVQQWASVHVSWVQGYLKTKFIIEVKQEGPMVVVLSQLDSRYFKNLEGQYVFDLHFVLQKESDSSEDYIVRANPGRKGERSVSAEINVKPGKYVVIPRVSAERFEFRPQVLDVVRLAATKYPQKLRQIGANYDISHAKGGLEDEEEKTQKNDVKQKRDMKNALSRFRHEAYVQGRQDAFAEARQVPFQVRGPVSPVFELPKSSIADMKDGPSKSADVKIKLQESSEEAAHFKSPEEPYVKDNKEAGLKERPRGVFREPEHVNSELITDKLGKDNEVKDEKTLESSAEEKTEDGPKSATEEETTNEPSEPKADTLKGQAQTETTDFKNKPTPPESKQENHTSVTDASSVCSDSDDESDVSTKIIRENVWNPVAVIGLRVYSKDPGVKVTLVKPQEKEKLTVLQLTGATGAGVPGVEVEGRT